MKRILLSGLLMLSAFSGLRSQCLVHLLVDTVEYSSIEICYGDSVNISAVGEYLLMQDNFEVQSPGQGWVNFVQYVDYQNSCGLGPNNSTYAWFADLSPPMRILETKDFNLTVGGYVSFDMRYGIQGYPTPCDGPDEMKEGVSLQYSTDSGQTWTDITYFAPTGVFLPSNPKTSLPTTYGSTPFTSWNNYKFIVPPAAQTANTRFRWFQEFANYHNGHYDDNWGIDNVKVSRNIQVETRWSHGPTVMNPPAVHPVDDSLFVVYVLNFADLTDTLATDSLWVDVHQTPVFGFVADTNRICEKDTLTISVTGSFNYNWSTGDHTPVIDVAPKNNTTYYVTSTDNLGCYYVDSVSVFVEKLPAILSFGDTICYGQQASIMASGGEGYVWSTGDTSSQIIVSPVTSSMYIVTVTGTNNCFDNDTILVVVNPLPQVSLTRDTTICYGDKAILKAAGGVEYLWSTGEKTKSISVDPTWHTQYTVLVRDANNCTAFDSVLVYVNPFHDFVLTSASDTICLATTVMLTADGAFRYKWSTGETTPEIEAFPYYTSTYSVTASDIFNGQECFVSRSTEVVVRDCNTLHMANAFSPKGFNTVYKPIGDFTNVFEYQFAIYDRWGKMVFYSRDPEAGWDGRINGDYVPTGVYAYKVSYIKGYTRQYFEKIGSVTVLQ